MTQRLAPAHWIRFTYILNSSARSRIALSGMAAAVQIYVCNATNFLVTQSYFQFWCWVITFDLGLTFATFGLSSARSWRGRLAASALLAFHLLLFFVLFIGALLNKFTGLIHEP
jgi:hypothetical protein